jgi:heme-degrading monooxygenase HmoA
MKELMGILEQRSGKQSPCPYLCIPRDSSLHFHLEHHYVIVASTTDSRKTVQKGRTSMFARVGTFQVQPGKMDEGIHIFRDSVVPTAKQQQGFKGTFLLTAQSSNRAITITLWETEADMRAGELSDYLREQIAKVASVLTAGPVFEAFEVAVQV